MAMMPQLQGAPIMAPLARNWFIGSRIRLLNSGRPTPITKDLSQPISLLAQRAALTLISAWPRRKPRLLVWLRPATFPQKRCVVSLTSTQKGGDWDFWETHA